MSTTRPVSIPKGLVVEAYKRVKRKGGGPGADNVSMEMFDQNLKNNLYKIWNRLSSGSYFPSPVKQVEIPKSNGGTRKLGVPTISDRIAQTVILLIVEPRLEKVFHPSSYGFRPGRNAQQAIEFTKRMCWNRDWVVEFDIKAAFDSLSHDLLERAIDKHVSEKWLKTYLMRWLRAKVVDKQGGIHERYLGTPQGGVVGPLLMNLFMHYAFDKWMEREHPRIPFSRYADDAVAHCASEVEAFKFLDGLRERLNEVGLEINEEKSGVVYCKDSNRRKKYPKVKFTYLGFDFRPRKAINKRGEVFTSFLPGISLKAKGKLMRTVGSWKLGRLTRYSMVELSKKFNPILRGWLQYYGKHYLSSLYYVFRHFDRALCRWIRRKFSNLAKHKTRAFNLMSKIRTRDPRLFVHWEKWNPELVK